jgi:hypothetical protein
LPAQLGVQHCPLVLHVAPAAHAPHVAPHPSGPHVLPAQLGVQIFTHAPPWSLYPALQPHCAAPPTTVHTFLFAVVHGFGVHGPIGGPQTE